MKIITIPTRIPDQYPMDPELRRDVLEHLRKIEHNLSELRWALSRK